MGFAKEQKRLALDVKRAHNSDKPYAGRGIPERGCLVFVPERHGFHVILSEKGGLTGKTKLTKKCKTNN